MQEHKSQVRESKGELNVHRILWKGTFEAEINYLTS
jgi:hypothetical protein